MTLPDFTAHDVAELADLLVAEDLADAMSRVSRVTCRTLSGCSCASVMLWRDGQPATVGDSSPRARGIDERQYTSSEGPSLDAVRAGAAVHVPDLSAESRWPAFATAATAEGVRSSLSLPLAAHGRVVGALNVYAERPDAFTPDDIALGELLAGHAALAVHGASLYFASRDLAEQLNAAMASRALVEQAKGVVMAQRGLSAAEAFEVLRSSAQAAGRRLHDIAAELVQSVVADGAERPG
jgi:GAF domain-containing protein